MPGHSKSQPFAAYIKPDMILTLNILDMLDSVHIDQLLNVKNNVPLDDIFTRFMRCTLVCSLVVHFF